MDQPGQEPPAASPDGGAPPASPWARPQPTASTAQSQSYTGWTLPPARRWRRWVLWVVLAGVLLVGGCAALIGVTAFRAGNGADHAVNDFLNAAQHGDTAGALRFACPSATAQNVPSARSHSIVGVHVIDIDGKITADVTVDIVMMNGQTHRDDVLLERDAGAWLVCGVRRQS